MAMKRAASLLLLFTAAAHENSGAQLAAAHMT